jgi:SM-20-related protein
MSALERLLLDLENQGWAVSDDIFPAELAHQLRAEGEKRWQQGHFHVARIGRLQSQELNTAIRGDTICWLETDDPYPAGLAFQQWAAQLQNELNRYFFAGLRRMECHYARYGSGAGYAQHIDQHVDSPHRKLSLVLYLNPEWADTDGGELAIYDSENPGTEITRVLPLSGRLVIFRSELTPHAVLPCQRPRWSLTGWFRTDGSNGLTAY